MRHSIIISLIISAAVLSGSAYAEDSKTAEQTPATVETAPKAVAIVAPEIAINTAAKAATKADDFSGYDFAQVVLKVETSVSPLQKVMAGSLKVFAESVDQAQVLIEQGKSKEAIQKCSVAMDTVLKSRDRVLDPMWKGRPLCTSPRTRKLHRRSHARTRFAWPCAGLVAQQASCSAHTRP